MAKKVEQKVIDTIGEAMQKALDVKNAEPNLFVVKYFTVKDDKFLGYHLDTFCSLTQDREAAKRYNGDEYKQLKTIRTNLDYILSLTEGEIKGEEGTGFLRTIMNTIGGSNKDVFFKGYKPEDIYILSENLIGDMPSQRMDFVIIQPNKDGTELQDNSSDS